MSIIAYPLNNVTYNAEDAQTYFSFRSSGVNSYYDDFIVSAKEGMTVTVSAGLGWMKPDDFMGFSVASTEPIDITLEASHATMGRYDRIVARYTAEDNSVEIVAKTGTPATEPEPPAIERSTSVYELGFCTIYIGPSVTSIVSSNISDTRSDSTVCGITGDSQTAGRSEIKIVFPGELVNQPYTVSSVTGPVYSGYVPSGLVDYVLVDQQNTTYTVTASVSGTNYTGSVELGPYYGQYSITVTEEFVGPSYTLSENSWATIHSTAAAGQAANYWDEGDTKPVHVNGNVAGTAIDVTVDAFIIGINHNSEYEGDNKIHFQLGKLGSNPIAFVDDKYDTKFNNTGFIISNMGNIGSWDNSTMYKTVLGNTGTPLSPPGNSFLAALPVDLRSVMQAVSKYSRSGDSATQITAATHYLWIMSEYEIKGTASTSSYYERNYQDRYSYYTSGNGYTFTDQHGGGTALKYWTRSAPTNLKNGWVFIGDNGSAMTDYCHCSFAVAPCFAV